MKQTCYSVPGKKWQGIFQILDAQGMTGSHYSPSCQVIVVGKLRTLFMLFFFFPLLFLEGTKIVPSGLARYVFDNMLHIKML